MSGDQLDLDAIEARMAEWQHILDTGRYDEDLVGELAGYVWPLVAEVRRLRARVARSDQWLAAANAVIRERALDEIECCASGSCEVCRR